MDTVESLSLEILDLKQELEYATTMKDQADRALDLQIKMIADREKALVQKDEEIKKLNDLIKIDFKSDLISLVKENQDLKKQLANYAL